jgi:hypothetical protein
MKRYLVVLTVVVAALALLVTCGGAAASPTPQLSKVCSAYAKDHFHDITAQLPDGTKCIGVGEYCSHGRGFARAYREYGYVCESDGRLEEL